LVAALAKLLLVMDLMMELVLVLVLMLHVPPFRCVPSGCKVCRHLSRLCRAVRQQR
jgi:hypothetical protein